MLVVSDLCTGKGAATQSSPVYYGLDRCDRGYKRRFEGRKLPSRCWLLLGVKTTASGSWNMVVNAPIKSTAFLDVKDCIEMIAPVDGETE